MQIVNDNLIKKWEKLELQAYLPTPNDKWTIGWGHTKTARPGMKITEAEAQRLFETDTAWVEDTLARLVKVPLNQYQYDALASLVFNIGWTKQTNKKTGKKEVLRGLVRRRTEEMGYFLTPVVDTPSEDFLPEMSTDDILKPLYFSKEVAAGVGAAVTGVTGVLGDLEAQLGGQAVWAFSAALVAFGLFVLWNRYNARRKGDR
jgi:GH24 family phage-related lysozyme (muramidase)